MGKSAPQATFGAWVAGQGLPGLIGLGLAIGALVSAPTLVVLQLSRADATRSASTPTMTGGARPSQAPPDPGPIEVAPSADPAVTAPVAPAVAAEAAPPDVPAAPASVARGWDGEEDPVAAVELPPPVIGMRAVLEGVRRTAASTAWQRSGRADPGLMRSVEVILRELRLATDDPTLDLPVRFGDVPPGLGYNPVRALHVAMSPAFVDRTARDPSPVVLDAGRASRAILIADGDVVLTSAEHCLILATGAVEVAYPDRCFIIAGRLIEASHDTASVLIAGSRVVVGHSYIPPRPPIRSAIYSAPDFVSAWPEGDLILLNSPYLSVSHGPGRRPLDWPALDFGDVNREARPAAWEGRITAVSGSWRYPAGDFQLRVEGVDDPIRVEVGRPIFDAAGRPVPELAGWQVYRSTSEYVMMYKGRRLVDLTLGTRDAGGRRGR